ncbi:hypothetical protein NCER_101577 [Vairimorpha ceranae BRL01]|uniref:RING-type domain-containing protein n=1 Tax=Vairimorpha ceranae (strain BRL01) TaxID=578460 RepID=C4VAC1_VAIC1|nr:hypothetical protein NCER_101577 [Vairimorpha ceranae BRL01]
MSKLCLICKSECSIPHWLPCKHIFCFLCIRRHIEKRNFCPECFKSPFSPADLRTNQKQYNKIDKLPILVQSREEHLVRELKKRRANSSGSKSALMYRYHELSINVDNERFREIPRNMDTIVRQLNQLEAENKQIRRKIEKDFPKAFDVVNKLKLKYKKNDGGV